MYRLALSVLIISCAFLPAAGLQQLNLPSVSSDRFTLAPDRTWPPDPGDAEVCVWAGDRLAALSVTIDDNWESDHKFWNAMHDSFDFHFTWFVMVDQVFAWPLWQWPFDDGHEVEGHDVCAINNYTDAKYEETVARTQQVLNTMVKGNSCRTYAYPCGTVKSAFTGKYYIACRGVVGGFNPANRIDYLNTRKNGLTVDNINTAIANRHWMQVLYHGIGSAGPSIKTALAHAKANEDDLWVDGFSRVAQYAQSRDTHALTITSTAADRITFTLSDDMLDSMFTQPLTVKVRVNNDWTGVLAMQDGVQRGAYTVTHNGDTYVLVDAVPDAGEVILAKAATAMLSLHSTRSPEQQNTRMYHLDATPVAGTPVRPGVYLIQDGTGSLLPKLIIP